MKKILNASILLIALLTPCFAFAASVPKTGGQTMDERLARIETRLDAIDKRFDDMNKRFDDMNRRLDSMSADINAQLNRMSAIFTALVISIIGFAIWDRRTMVRPFEDKVKKIEDDIAENRSKLHALLESLKALGKTDEKVAEVLKRFNLL